MVQVLVDALVRSDPPECFVLTLIDQFCGDNVIEIGEGCEYGGKEMRFTIGTLKLINFLV
jgi:hypothetical protein